MSYQVKIDSMTRDEWEERANSFSDYSIYQTWPYQLTRAETEKQDVSRIVIEDTNRTTVIMAQVRIKHVAPLGLKIGYVQWGPLFRKKDDTINCSVEMLNQFKNAYLRTKVNVLRITPNVLNDETGQKVFESLQASGFEHVQSYSAYRTFILDVSDNEDEIRKRLRKSFRRDLKKAEKADMEILEGHDENLCRIFEDLYRSSLKRKGFKGLDPQEFLKPMQTLSKTEQMNIHVVLFQDKPASALLSTCVGDTSLVLLAASNELGLKCGSSYLAWYQGAVSAHNAGMKFYDLGGIDPVNNPNVFQFKSRMGGREVFHIGTYEACSSSLVKNTWWIAQKIYYHIKKVL